MENWEKKWGFKPVGLGDGEVWRGFGVAKRQKCAVEGLRGGVAGVVKL